MSQHKEHNLQGLGIESPLKLHGDLRVLREESGLPVVFLIDEHHGNLNDCIDKNIENAKELIKNANVQLVGVESLAGGKEWDIEDYRTDDPNGRFYEEFAINWRNKCTKFYDELRVNYELCIQGVESIGMMDKIEIDSMPGNDYFRLDVSNHPLQKVRSRHFIRTLFEHYNSKHFSGNLILNCGANHNTHIEEWVRIGEIDSIANYKANYIRLNAIDN